MGNRSGHQDDVMIIDYETRKDVREKYGTGQVRIHEKDEAPVR